MTSLNHNKEVILVSACLVGLATRYDGKSKRNSHCLAELNNHIWVPVCPEQLGGLPTPRVEAQLTNGDGFSVLNCQAKVICVDGRDVTKSFIKGAEMVLEIAESLQVDRIFLKAKSPSCAVTERLGVTAALLKQKGFTLQEF